MPAASGSQSSLLSSLAQRRSGSPRCSTFAIAIAPEYAPTTKAARASAFGRSPNALAIVESQLSKRARNSAFPGASPWR